MKKLYFELIHYSDWQNYYVEYTSTIGFWKINFNKLYS